MEAPLKLQNRLCAAIAIECGQSRRRNKAPTGSPAVGQSYEGGPIASREIAEGIIEPLIRVPLALPVLRARGASKEENTGRASGTQAGTSRQFFNGPLSRRIAPCHRRLFSRRIRLPVP